jgi:hypothetical protein
MARNRGYAAVDRGIRRVLGVWDGPVELAYAIAFPIVKLVYRVRELRSRELGVVESFVCEAVERFGPSSLTELQGLLGLDEVLLNRVLRSLSAEEGPLVDTATGAWSIRRAGQPHSHVVEHDRAFAIAGVGGQLLPVNHLAALENNRLCPRGDGLGFDTMDGVKLRLRGYFAPALTNELTSIEHLADATPEERASCGLPPGTLEILERRVEQEETWFVGAALIGAGESFSIRPWSAPNIDLVVSPFATAGYLFRAGVDLRFSDSKRADLAHLEAELQKSLAGVRLRRGSAVGEALLDHDGALSIADLTSPRTAWVSSALSDGIWWHARTGAVVRLRPGSPRVARVLWFLIALQEIGQRFGAILTNPAEWLSRLTKQVNDRLPPGVALPNVDPQQLVRELRSVSDTELQDRLDQLENAIGT